MGWEGGHVPAEISKEKGGPGEAISRQTIDKWIKGKSTKTRPDQASRFLRFTREAALASRAKLSFDNALAGSPDYVVWDHALIAEGPGLVVDPIGRYVEALTALFWTLFEDRWLHDFVFVDAPAIGEILRTVEIEHGYRAVENASLALGLTAIGFHTYRPSGDAANEDDVAGCGPVLAGLSGYDDDAFVGRPFLGRHASPAAWWFLRWIRGSARHLDARDREVIANYILAIPPGDDGETGLFEYGRHGSFSPEREERSRLWPPGDTHGPKQ